MEEPEKPLAGRCTTWIDDELDARGIDVPDSLMPGCCVRCESSATNSCAGACSCAVVARSVAIIWQKLVLRACVISRMHPVVLLHIVDPLFGSHVAHEDDRAISPAKGGGGKEESNEGRKEASRRRPDNQGCSVPPVRLTAGERSSNGTPGIPRERQISSRVPPDSHRSKPTRIPNQHLKLLRFPGASRRSPPRYRTRQNSARLTLPVLPTRTMTTIAILAQTAATTTGLREARRRRSVS